MKNVSTKEALKRAIEAKEDQIIIEGELAKQLSRKKKVSKGTAIGSIAALAGGIIAAPFTGGTSLIASGMGAAALSGSAVIILAAIAAATGLSLYAIKKEYNVVELSGGYGEATGTIRLTRK